MNSKKRILLTMLLIIILSITGCTKESNGPISRTEFLMDTVMTVKIFDKPQDKILDEVFSRLEDIENKMSYTIETSDVSKINQNAGIKPIKVSQETYNVIKEAIYFAELSSGAYDPTIGPLVELWNVKTEEHPRESIPSITEINEKKKLVNYKNLELLEDNQVYLKEKNMKINLGSIVKGYAADEVRKVLIKNGVNSAIIDLGGNVFAHGAKAEDTPWTIGLQNPLEYTGSYLGTLRVKDKSIVTSGDYERYFIYQDKRYHHILDTNTGYPTENEITGVSIISDKSIDGDAFSTTLFVLGLEKGMELAKSIDNIDAIFVTKDGTVYVPSELLSVFFIREELSSFNVKEY